MTFSENLKNARIQKKYTKSKMAELLGIPYTSYNNYENGREPKVAMMLEIANLLDTTLYELIGKESMSKLNPTELKDSWIYSSPVLTNAELAFLKKYRNLDNHGKNLVKSVINIEFERCQKPTEFIQIEPPVMVSYYGHIASAGTGQFVFDDIPPELIEIEAEDAEHVDFAIGVNGDSMEPTYFDGDVLLISKQSSINKGEIGIFMIDGEAYVKELGNGRLLSHNEKYADIPLTEDTICIGKVVGKN